MLAAELAQSVGFASGAGAQPLASVRREHSRKRGGCLPGNDEGPLPLIVGGVILYCPLMPGNFNTNKSY